jgi:hypothetical protein
MTEKLIDDRAADADGRENRCGDSMTDGIDRSVASRSTIEVGSATLIFPSRVQETRSGTLGRSAPLRDDVT